MFVWFLLLLLDSWSSFGAGLSVLFCIENTSIFFASTTTTPSVYICIYIASVASSPIGINLYTCIFFLFYVHSVYNPFTLDFVPRFISFNKIHIILCPSFIFFFLDNGFECLKIIFLFVDLFFLFFNAIVMLRREMENNSIYVL